jgi:hypothetical protein
MLRLEVRGEGWERRRREGRAERRKGREKEI